MSGKTPEIHELAALLQEAVDYEKFAFIRDEEVNGGDLVEWFAEWRVRAEKALG